MLQIFSGNRPDITPAQIGGFLIGGIPILANLGQAFGIFALSQAEQDSLKQAAEWGVVGGGALFFADAHIRNGRNKADAARDAAVLSKISEPPKLPEDIAIPPLSDAGLTGDDVEQPEPVETPADALTIPPATS